MNILSPTPAPDEIPASKPGQARAHDAAVQEAQNVRFDLWKVWALVRRNLPLIAVTVGVALLAGLVISLLTTPRYVATARIQIEQQSDRILQNQDSEVVAPSQDTERFLQTQLDILRSRALAISVARSLNLFGNARFYTAMGSPPSGAGQGAGALRLDREKTIELLRSSMSVDLPRNSRITSIAFESTDPALSAQVANAFANDFITSNLQRKFDSSAYARNFLSRQLVETKARLEQSERELNDYARSAGLVPSRMTTENGSSSTTSAGSTTTSSLSQLNAALNEALIARTAAEQQWRVASATPTMSLREVIGNTTIQSLTAQRAQLTAELNEARARYRADYPVVQERQAQVAELSSQIAALAALIKHSIRDQYEVALKQETSLTSQLNGVRQQTQGEQDRSVRFNILAREVDTNRTLYDGLLQRFKELSATAGVASNNISIVDIAEAPVRPSSPRTMFNLALALLAGLVLASVLVFLREHVDDVVRSPEDIERKLGLKTFGIVPRTSAGDNIIAQLDAPRSPISEAFSTIRSSLLYSTPSGLPASLLITSSQASEGKSTTTYALARSLARLGRRVVICDADLRRPSMHAFFDMDHAIGLSNLLVGDATIEQVARTTDLPNLSIITAGPIPPAPSDLLGSNRIAEVIAQLEAAYDVVIIDGPPVLGLADAPTLASQTMATLFVVEANRGARGRTKNAVKRLRTSYAELLGVVLNKFEAHRAGAYDYYGYEYYAYGSNVGPKPQSAAGR